MSKRFEIDTYERYGMTLVSILEDGIGFASLTLSEQNKDKLKSIIELVSTWNYEYEHPKGEASQTTTGGNAKPLIPKSGGDSKESIR